MIKRTPKAEALQQLTLNLLELTSAMETKATELTAPHGQTPSRWKVLTSAAGSPHTVPQIARRMGLSRQAVQKIANALVADGLAFLEDNPDHKTSPFLRLTPKGVKLTEAIGADHTKWANAFSKSFTLDNLKTTAGTLRQLCDRLLQEDTPENKRRPRRG